MDVTIRTALKIISTLPDKTWRKSYWISVVQEEIDGYKAVGLYNQATLLEKELNDAIQQEVS